MKKIKLLVLEGGFNEEHEISLQTGTMVKKCLSKLNIYYESLVVNPLSFKNILNEYNQEYICFNCLHGTFGEDGKIQKILDHRSFKYTHSNQKASFIGFNKDLSKQEISDLPVLTPDYISLNYSDINEKIIIDIFRKFKAIVIKPVSSGSSFGIQILKEQKSLSSFINNFRKNSDLYKNHEKLLIEKYIPGRELTVTVMEKNKESYPIEVTEIELKKDYFDYQSKYSKGYSKHILPALIPKHIYEQCKFQAKIIHDKIGCSGISRSDFLYYQENIYFLEINTQPGLTPISLVPEQLRYQKLSFEDLILNIIDCAM